MVDEIVIYEKSTCTKCRVAHELLDQNGVPYRAVRYHDTPLSKEKLEELIRKIGITPKELVRTKDPLFRSLEVDLAVISDAEAIDLMLQHPDLIQRPILERGERAIIGRPSERITAFLAEK